MKHIGLFEGIGGFSLAARWMGWETVAWSEWNPFCQRLLKYHFPKAEAFGNITTSDFSKYENTIGIVTAGFPCQPVSTAGERKGIEDDRWGWPQTRRAYKQIKPRVLLLENVSGLFSILEPKSLSEMESKEIKLFCEDETLEANTTVERIQRRVIATIIEEVKQDGYVLPTIEDGTPIICCVPACAVNAPHRRDRVWIVAFANSDSNGFEYRRFGEDRQAQGKSEGEENQRKRFWNDNRGVGEQKVVTDTERNGSDKSKQTRPPKQRNQDVKERNIDSDSNSEGFSRSMSPTRQARRDESGDSSIIPNWNQFPTQPPICYGDDGVSSRLDGITFSKWRIESIQAGGNAIVPQVAFEFFKSIEHELHKRNV